jgi:DNA-binding IclR family transcriptional regulator
MARPVTGGEAGREYANKGLSNGLKVFKYLASGDILGWKSLREVAQAVGVTVNQAYGALETLVAEDLAEKSERGFRQSPQGLTFYALQAMEAISRANKQIGIKG